MPGQSCGDLSEAPSWTFSASLHNSLQTGPVSHLGGCPLWLPHGAGVCFEFPSALFPLVGCLGFSFLGQFKPALFLRRRQLGLMVRVFGRATPHCPGPLLTTSFVFLLMPMDRLGFVSLTNHMYHGMSMWGQEDGGTPRILKKLSQALTSCSSVW